MNVNLTKTSLINGLIYKNTSSRYFQGKGMLGYNYFHFVLYKFGISIKKKIISSAIMHTLIRVKTN